MGWIEHDHADIEGLSRHLAQMLHAACRAAIDTRGRAVLALAGGRTPFPAYRALAAMRLDWSCVVVVPSDERCVPHDHPASNLTELRKAFSDARGITIESLTTDDGDPARSEAHARSRLATLPDTFDAIVLGMGQDAHTASLFPGAPQLRAALDLDNALDATRIDPDPLPPEAPFPRITLTLSRLLRTRALHLAITGQAKRDVLQAARASGNILRHPVAAIGEGEAAVHVHWSP
ncbi:6-phosphogluconolactonase [Lysobacter dokdonensis DS-58]|uniref:6-phosphogluconolactonase n=1 Tax=Lysobacter dokdonensis DS-58 TaxID=1300345 RepID=A0A0A2WK31_9GAMM|nr:6-phosphogluconolactonase [Lysobacter dokdonensis]KGQ20541.1 6-phosphogluconolactonase [Lysobacter dokdonensis DS-58]